MKVQMSFAIGLMLLMTLSGASAKVAFLLFDSSSCWRMQICFAPVP